jgi:hypothetical protein
MIDFHHEVELHAAYMRHVGEWRGTLQYVDAEVPRARWYGLATQPAFAVKETTVGTGAWLAMGLPVPRSSNSYEVETNASGARQGRPVEGEAGDRDADCWGPSSSEGPQKHD